MSPYRVVGLDLSLTSTGMSDGTRHQVVQTTPDEPLEARLDMILNGAHRFVLGLDLSTPTERVYDADLVVIEGAAFSKGGTTGSAAEILGGLRLMVRHLLWARSTSFALVGPSTLKSYTTGHGGASKAQMVAAVQARHGLDLSSVKVKDGRYDMADAAALAAMGYAHLGQPLLTQGPPGPLKSLLAVKWPPVERKPS